MAVLGHILDLFLKVYELSLPGADSWVFVSETQNSTYKLTIFELLKTWRKWEEKFAKLGRCNCQVRFVANKFGPNQLLLNWKFEQEIKHRKNCKTALIKVLIVEKVFFVQDVCILQLVCIVFIVCIVCIVNIVCTPACIEPLLKILPFLVPVFAACRLMEWRRVASCMRPLASTSLPSALTVNIIFLLPLSSA